MRKIAIYNQKGGVAKTTTSVNLAAGLSRNNKKVILIDMDPQGDISVCHNTDAQYDLYHFLMEDADIKDCISTLGKNLDIIHCDHKMAEAEIKLSKENEIGFLDEKLSNITDYDYVILDCPPSWRFLNKSVLRFVSEVLIPSSTDVLGFSSLKKTIKRIDEFNMANNLDVKISSILPTMFDQRNKICKEIYSKMKKEYGPLLVATPIRMNSKLKEAPKAKKSIFSYDKKSAGAEDYWKFVKLNLENEYMYDLGISKTQREKAQKEYFVDGKKREMVIVGDKITFSYKFVANVNDSIKSTFMESPKKKKVIPA